MSLLKCENLSFAYQGKKVLENVNFELKEKDYLTILGENGSGKSTLIKGLLGLKEAQEGKIIYGGGLNGKKIGYLPQQTEIQRDFPATVGEIVLSGCLNSLGWRPFYSRADKKRAIETMDLLGIGGLSKSSFRQLSGGQQQRVLLARALLATKQLLLLDEPLAGLDPLVAQDFYQVLDQVNQQGITLIIVSHDVHSAVQRADKVLHLGGRQLFFGSSEAYRESDLGRSYLGLDQGAFNV